RRYAAACCRARSTRLPSARLTSPRCSPQFGGSDPRGWYRGASGLPTSGTWSQVNPLPSSHFALYSFGYSTHGVGADGGSPAGAPIGPGNRLVLKYGWSVPVPVNDVGLTHST